MEKDRVFFFDRNFFNNIEFWGKKETENIFHIAEKINK